MIKVFDHAEKMREFDRRGEVLDRKIKVFQEEEKERN